MEKVLLEKRGQVAYVTINRPERLNACDQETYGTLAATWAALQDDDKIRVGMLTGAGERAFCAGSDIREDSFGQGDRVPDNGLFPVMHAARKPIIAAINGPVAGLGFAISLFADMRFASDRAVFTTAFSQRGLIAEWGISWILTRLVGPAHALDLLFSSRKFDAAEAARIGLVNRVLPDAELLPFVKEYAREMAANCSPRSIAIMKRQVYQHMTESLEHAQRDSVQLMFESFKAPDFKEGVTSFMEKRPPQFDRIG